MVGGWVVLQMVCGDSLTQDRDAIDCCDCDVVSRKRVAAGGVAVSSKRIKACVAMMLDVLPEEIIEKILLSCMWTHVDRKMFMSCCTTFRKLLQGEEVWKHLAGRCIMRESIIPMPVKRRSNETWQTYYKRKILSLTPGRDYLKRQQHVSALIRAPFINWMLSLVEEAKKDFKTFVRMQACHRCVAYFDRFLGAVATNITLDELQRVGGACVLLALHMKDPNLIDKSSYEFVCFFTDGAVSVEQLTTAVKTIYSTLSIHNTGCPDKLRGNSRPDFPALEVPFVVPGCMYAGEAFVHTKLELWPSCSVMKISRDDDDDCLLTCMKMLQMIGKDNTHNTLFYLCQYLMELALQSEVVLKYEGPVVAAASFAFSSHTGRQTFNVWRQPFLKIVEDGGLRPETVYDCITDLSKLFAKSQSIILQCNKTDKFGKKDRIPALIVKYCRNEQQRVASLLPADDMPPKWWENTD